MIVGGSLPEPRGDGTPRPAGRITSIALRGDKRRAVSDLLSAIGMLHKHAKAELTERGSLAFMEMRLLEVAEYSLKAFLSVSFNGSHKKGFADLCKASLAGMRDVAEEVAGRRATYRANLEAMAGQD